MMPPEAGKPGPLIGICAHTGPMRLSVYDMPATFVPKIFVDRVAAVDCTPVLLPPLLGIEAACAALDGLLLLPGPDVGPALYAADRHPSSRVDAGRDAAELALLTAALAAGLPVLGVCRGLQLLNTLCGGTLHQHLPDVLHNEEHSPGETVFGEQPITVRAGSRLAGMLAAGRPVVPCHHHQAIDRLGAGLTATAWADDGIIEAIELTDHPFAVAVQWHAEQCEHSGPFLALADAARKYRSNRHCGAPGGPR